MVAGVESGALGCAFASLRPSLSAMLPPRRPASSSCNNDLKVRFGPNMALSLPIYIYFLEYLTNHIGRRLLRCRLTQRYLNQPYYLVFFPHAVPDSQGGPKQATCDTPHDGHGRSLIREHPSHDHTNPQH